jgi:hypothetical protein
MIALAITIIEMGYAINEYIAAIKEMGITIIELPKAD